MKCGLETHNLGGDGDLLLAYDAPPDEALTPTVMIRPWW